MLPPTLPPMTRLEAQRIATKITRKFWPGVRRSYVYPSTSVRRVWISSEPTSADNHDKGLGRLIHDLSHDVFEAVYPARRAHDPLHAKYETDIAAYVAGSSWLKRVTAPKPARPKPPLEERHAQELTRLAAAEKRWTTKAKRAATALKKIRARKRRLERLYRERDEPA